MWHRIERVVWYCLALWLVCSGGFAGTGLATPANKAALEKHYDTFLAKKLARCTTCHLPVEHRNPESLDEIPHNKFGARLYSAGRQMASEGKGRDLRIRLQRIAGEDSDEDGVDNETELLLGYNPGDPESAPSDAELGGSSERRGAFEKFLASYRWQPFEPVIRPEVPKQVAANGGSERKRMISSSLSGSPKIDSPRPFVVRNPIDAYIAAEHQARGLKPRPEASKEILLRRVYLDLIGLSPTPDELRAFENDSSAEAYEKIVERLLADPRHGERWARHWMDVWRYSDWAGWSGGNQIRDSKPHIWRWRDWIVDSLNSDKPYAAMLMEMLAADELAPLDTNALRATGFLVRNYKMLSREQWLEDTVKHTSQAFLGVTMGCARCHDHMTDPVSQTEYFQLRAIFEPHWVRTDRLPGDTNIMNLGLVRTYDTDTNPPTYFFQRGDERRPDTNRVLAPAVPLAFGGRLDIEPVSLPRLAGFPDHREFVIADSVAASERALKMAEKGVAAARTNQSSGKLRDAEMKWRLAQAEHDALLAVTATERFDQQIEPEQWKAAATNAVQRQRFVAIATAVMKAADAQAAEAAARNKLADAEAKVTSFTNDVGQAGGGDDEPVRKARDAASKAIEGLGEAKKKLAAAEKALADAEEKLLAPIDTAFRPRPAEIYPTNSTGRRLAFARWLVSTNNPLTARVAANHIWLRHFGRGIVETPHDFGRSGKPPSHPQLLDWLASELMHPEAGSLHQHSSETGMPPHRTGGRAWSMKHLHRLIVTSSIYRMASTPDSGNAAVDPDNVYLWRMNSRRMEAELVRDNLLYVAGELEPAMGGPEIDHTLGLKSGRRSLYLRLAAEKEVEFLKLFDGPAVTECYLRRPSVVPQQALALANSEMTVRLSKALSRRLSAEADDETFARAAFTRVLARHATERELTLCREFIETRTANSSTERARDALIMVLFNHNEFVTIR